MLFHTWTFAAFLLIAWPVYLAVKATRLKSPWLLLVSYVFYGWWNPLYLLLIVFLTTVDYLVALGMARSARKTRWLLVSLASNLGLLGFFKYAGFVVNSLNDLLAWAGLHYAIPAPDVLLPVGISFYVFRSMSYVIDGYRGDVQPERHFIRYATYVSFFPQLVAGPIERAGHLLPQLRQPAKFSPDELAEGLSLFVVGLFKKIALADYLTLYVDKVYAAPGQFDSPALLLATFAFGWQIYFDFSGYTDMARGVARLFGVRLMLNFNNPYLATSLGDFWRRWHISLSTWFRDYLYIPLGGNRAGTFNTYRNIFLTMLMCGLWHGAAGTFVVWGLLHAGGQLLTRRLEASTFYKERVPPFAKRFWVFAFVTFAWVFFRAATFSDACLVVRRLLASPWSDPAFPLLAVGLICAVWGYQFVYESRFRSVLRTAPVRVGAVVAMVLYMLVFVSAGNQPFIYLKF
jgi:D-alanyl-lipoteichoic acid acyltransferase DltB (MBOAT superfamily)